MMLLVSVLAIGKGDVFAASNPYPSQQNVDGDGYYEVPCTRFAWQQVYDNTGIALPAWGNAVNWWENAKNAGYATGSAPRAGAIAVWSGDYYGHVAYVTSGSGNTFTVNEGGRTDLDQTSSHGIKYGYTLTNAVGGARPYDTNKTLLGFIYPTEKANSTPSYTGMSWGGYTSTPARTDAYIYVRATPETSGTFTQNGLTIWDSKGNVVKQKTDYININYSYLNIWYNITEELGIKLECGSAYKYQYWVVFNGRQYYSEVQSFTTTGSHSYDSWKVTASPTCTKTGAKYRTCTECGHKEQGTIAANGHKSYTVTQSATVNADGAVITKCSTCKVTLSETKIYRAKTVELKASAYTYNGKAKLPAVVVKDSQGKVISPANYTVTYKNNKKVGSAAVLVTGKCNYSGTLTEKYQIRPKATSISKIKAAKKSFTVNWKKKTKQVTGYEVMYATNSRFTKNVGVQRIKNYKTVSRKITGLKAKKKYYVKVRTYKTVSGVNYYSGWSKGKTVITKR